MDFELVATSTFGVEAVLKKEIKQLGFEITDSRNGRISFKSDERGLAISNLWLRTADRIYLKLAEFHAVTFEELFQQTGLIEWENFIPEDAAFIVTGTSTGSILHSVPACQSIIEKAVINRLAAFYHKEWFEKSGDRYTIRFLFQNDQCLICLDSSGDALHKRGYRVRAVAAPIKETMASALIQLSYFEKNRMLCDPMCGSGTIAIEAAMIALNIAPGLNRSFDSMHWSFIPQSVWREEKKRAFSLIKNESEKIIFASDIDQRTLDYARENSIEAGAFDIIHFSVRDITGYKAGMLFDGSNAPGCIVTNPPYGQRIGDKKNLTAIYNSLSYLKTTHASLELNVISADKNFEKFFGRAADKRRKLYNGNIECCYYQYFGR